MVAYSFKKRFIVPIQAGLGIELKSFSDLPPPDKPYPKRQTIRAIGKRRHARQGETLQLYTAMRTKQCRKIGDAQCMSVEGVLLKWSAWQAFVTYDISEIEPSVWRRVGNVRPILDMEAFARLDGFANFDDMATFWREEHGPETFEGVLIKWEPFNG